MDTLLCAPGDPAAIARSVPVLFFGGPPTGRIDRESTEQSTCSLLPQEFTEDLPCASPVWSPGIY